VGRLAAQFRRRTTIRRANGNSVVIDGPFAETREVAGGLYLIACDSIAEASEWACKLVICDGDAIEIRHADGFWWIHHE